ncbi:ATP synthase F1 subunit gamma [Proteinivorax hydrogeniformans]|uniref:ATP synthase gamma chain n=1 Tax=Proteinivorax hydrogeniformans TaxID=1826727 RepID=A0AAU8HTS8_9FIRM
MQGIRDIKRRIKTVKNTQQITKAMEMVAASKLRKAQALAYTTRPYEKSLKEVASRVLTAGGDVEHKLIQPSKEGKPGYIVVTADRGLCGGYNSNVIKKACTIDKDNSYMITVGKKGKEALKARGYNIVAEFMDIGDLPSYNQARSVFETASKLLDQGIFSELNVIYTEFVNAMQQNVVLAKLTPVKSEDEKNSDNVYLYEPSAQQVFDTLIPKYLTGRIYRSLVESKASEHGARMTAMGSATDNATDMINELTLSYNKARQDSITQELIEIVSGAQALD